MNATERTAPGRLMFASRTPNPEPLREYMECRHGDTPDGSPYDCIMCRPVWVEHPHVQHNEPNPILVAYRSHLAKHRLTMDAPAWAFSIDAFDTFGGYVTWNDPATSRHPIITATDEQRDHARRVLTRLVSLAEVPA